MRRALWRNLTLCTIYREQSFSMYEFSEGILLYVRVSGEILLRVRIVSRNLNLGISSPKLRLSVLHITIT